MSACTSISSTTFNNRCMGKCSQVLHGVCPSECCPCLESFLCFGRECSVFVFIGGLSPTHYLCKLWERVDEYPTSCSVYEYSTSCFVYEHSTSCFCLIRKAFNANQYTPRSAVASNPGFLFSIRWLFSAKTDRHSTCLLHKIIYRREKKG